MEEHDKYKKIIYKHPIAFDKVVKINPKVTPTDFRRAIHPERQNKGTEITVSAFNINSPLIFVTLSLSNTM